MGHRRMGKPTVDRGGESEQERFSKLIRQHYRVLYRAAYRLTRSVVDAEDLVQEVCVRAYPRLGEIEGLDQPRSWLLRVLYRLFVDLHRRYERTNVRAIGEDEEFASYEPSPAEEAERALDRWRIEDAWRHLNKEQRLLLVLHDVEGYSLAEIHSLTGMKDGTIKSRLHRARVRLGRLLQRDRVTPALAGERGS
jgi:RNA polymerase sigma factor (sigma-70 family)